MYLLVFLLLLALIACIILFPEFFNKLMLFRIRPDARPEADRLVPVAVIALLVFASLFFVQLTASGQMKPLRSNLHGAVLLLTDLFLAAFGAVECIAPIWFMSRLIPKLKKVANGHTVNQDAAFRITLISKLLGITLLFVAAFLARSFFAASF
jgi:hypothetical protein